MKARGAVSAWRKNKVPGLGNGLREKQNQEPRGSDISGYCTAKIIRNDGPGAEPEDVR